MALQLTETFTFPALGSRRSEFTENADGSALCTYRATSVEGVTRAATFTGANIVASWDANDPHLDAVKAAYPAITTSTQAATMLLFARMVLRAQGDHEIGIEDV